MKRPRWDTGPRLAGEEGGLGLSIVRSVHLCGFELLLDGCDDSADDDVLHVSSPNEPSFSSKGRLITLFLYLIIVSLICQAQ